MKTHSSIDWPPVLLRRWLLTAAAGLGFLLAGLAAFLALQDRILLVLSLLLTLLTFFRCLTFYRMAAAQSYDSIKGVCISVKRNPTRKQQTVRLMTPDGTERTFTLDKQTRLRVGNSYLVYFRSSPAVDTDHVAFQQLLIQDVVLGLEDLGEYHVGEADTEPTHEEESR